MAIEQHRKTFNDGFVNVMKQETIRNAAKKVIGHKPIEIAKLRFSETSIREMDINFAESVGLQLDMKIEVLNAPVFNRKSVDKLTIQLRDENYSIIKTDKSKNSLYLYLQRIGEQLDESE
ncbi:phage head-tail adapter protein [Bacillus toyonensis]|uniref:phage head-tail adapter protein n=1 Tax=Bacillus toyonensis TaxID=155322 RepID=UPI002707A68A|nr:phage head-tail adapter protein [Bacillus toyonensis]MDO8159125.1 phage head-tail adapter protein [Bacillus toyonensis]